MTLPRYQRLAAELEGEIRSGKRPAGERLPSIREFARLRRVSINTAIASLRQVESLGLIEARAKAGYFVRRITRTDTPALSLPRPPRTPRDVAVNRLVTQFGPESRSGNDSPEFVPLGGAVPEAAWFPFKALRAGAARQLRSHPELFTTYGPLAGETPLREAILGRYRAMGTPIDSDELVITNGCSEALHLALQAVGRPGGVVAVESPTYFGFLQLIERLGMKALELPTDPGQGIHIDALERALAARSQICCLLLVSSFGNPLGSCLPEASKRELVRLCARHRLPIIEDDIYGDLHFSPQRPLPMKAFDTDGQVMLCSSFSKTLAPGARIGWIAAGRWTDPVQLGKRILSHTTPSLQQRTLAEYLEKHRYERHLVRLRTRCATQVERFSEAIERHFPAGTALSRPGGGFVLWVQMPLAVDSEQLFDAARRHHISILPGQVFSTTNRYHHCIRINCARTWSAETDKAVRTLGRLARKLHDSSQHPA